MDTNHLRRVIEGERAEDLRCIIREFQQIYCFAAGGFRLAGIRPDSFSGLESKIEFAFLVLAETFRERVDGLAALRGFSKKRRQAELLVCGLTQYCLERDRSL